MIYLFPELKESFIIGNILFQDNLWLSMNNQIEQKYQQTNREKICPK